MSDYNVNEGRESNTSAEPVDLTELAPPTEDDAPTHEATVEALLSGILFALNEQNRMLAEAVGSLSQVGEKVEGLFGGKDGKPASTGQLLSKLFLG